MLSIFKGRSINESKVQCFTTWTQNYALLPAVVYLPCLLYRCHFNKDLFPSLWYSTLPQHVDFSLSRKSIKLTLSGFGGGGRWSRCLLHLPRALTYTSSEEGTIARISAPQKRNQRTEGCGSQAERTSTIVCSWEKGKRHTAMFKQR